MMSQKMSEKTSRKLHLIVTRKDKEELDWFIASTAGLGC